MAPMAAPELLGAGRDAGRVGPQGRTGLPHTSPAGEAPAVSDLVSGDRIAPGGELCQQLGGGSRVCGEGSVPPYGGSRHGLRGPTGGSAPRPVGAAWPCCRALGFAALLQAAARSVGFDRPNNLPGTGACASPQAALPPRPARGLASSREQGQGWPRAQAGSALGGLCPVPPHCSLAPGCCPALLWEDSGCPLPRGPLPSCLYLGSCPATCPPKGRCCRCL